MRKLRALWIRLCGLIGARRDEDDFAAELESHIAMHTEDGIRAGLTPVEARRQALIALGGAEQTRQAYRERRTLPWLENLLRDVRYALRGFRRNPAFTITVIVTLAVGIGATTAVFSVVDRILFRSLPYTHDDRLVSVGLVDPVIPQEFMLGGSYYEWRDNQKPFEAFSSQGAVPHACDLVERNPALLSCASVEQNFLPMLGIAPLLGRNFLPEEDRPNGPKVALISYGLWLTHYGLDPRIVNRLIDIDGNQIRVVGVLPKDFELPTLQAADVIVPQALDEMAQRGAAPAGSPMYAFARLKPGVSIEQAKAALQPEFNRTLSLAPPAFRKELYLRVRSIRDRQVHDVRLLSWIMFGSVLSVLLIACANVAGLMMARSESRERELAVRSALGASRGRLIQQALTEAALLSLAGAAAGIVLAEGLLRVFLKLAPTGIPFLTRAGVDLRIASFTVLLALLCGALFGLLPALQKPRAVALAARITNSRRRTVLRRSLVAGQIAVSMILLSGAALLLRSFQNIEQQRLGMQTEGVLTARIALPRFRYDTGQKKMNFYLQAEAALKRLPGVRAVGVSDSMPPGDVHGNQIYSIIGIADKPRMTGGTGGMVAWRGVTPDYFSSLDIPILRGQAFTEEERTANEHYMILSSQLASRLFGNEDPIGKRIQPVPDGPWYIVSGIAANVKNAGLTAEDVPEYYRLRRNLADDWDADSVMVLKTSLSPKAVAPWVRSQIAGIDPTVPVEIETLSEQVSKLADRPRFETALLSFFAFCGLLMAVIGLYGVIAFLAAQRTQEIGVRMALGATRLDILRLIVGEGLRLIVVGGILGFGATLGTAQLLKSLLYNVRPHDPLLYAAALLLLALVALAATLLPARRAASIDPMQALRTE
jgi:predicted permease